MPPDPLTRLRTHSVYPSYAPVRAKLYILYDGTEAVVLIRPIGSKAQEVEVFALCRFSNYRTVRYNYTLYNWSDQRQFNTLN